MTLLNKATKISEAQMHMGKFISVIGFLLLAFLSTDYASGAVAQVSQEKQTASEKQLVLNKVMDGNQQQVSMEVENVLLISALRRLAKEVEVGFSFQEYAIPDKKVTVNFNEVPIYEALDTLLKGTNLEVALSPDRDILVIREKLYQEFEIQQETVTGTVIDAQSGETLPGVNVMIKGTTTGTSTDSEGNYELDAPSLQDTLIFSFVGYQSQELSINGRTEINVALQSQAIAGEELVVVGYGTQEQATVTGSISSIRRETIESIPTSDLSSGLAGQLPGIRVVQNSSEPGSFDTDFDIRGFDDPLIVVDGIVVEKRDFVRLSPASIEDITILKDASAAVYGVKAANGVVLVTTRSGEIGKPTVTYSGNYELRKFTQTLEPLDAYNFAVLTTEAEINNGVAPSETIFRPEDIEAYRNGTNPGTDWYDLVTRDYSTKRNHDLSVSGGTERIQYFTSLGFLDEMGMWKSGDLNYEKYNLRANIVGQITDDLEIELSVDGLQDQKTEPSSSAYIPGIIGSMYFSLLMQSPIEPVYANNNPEYLNEAFDGQHPLGITDADIGGYRNTELRTFQGNYTMNYEVPFVDGLNASLRYGYYNLEGDQTTWTKKFLMYTYDESRDTYINTATNNDPSTLAKDYSSLQRSTLFGQLTYKNTFFENHNINSTLVFERRHEKNDNVLARSQFDVDVDQFYAGTKNFQVDSDNIYEIENQNVIGRLIYDYSLKYLLEFGFNYGGSSLFPERSRWGFFPYVSAGWTISEEDFFRNSLPFITELKLRGSWGQMGDDGAAAYQFLTGYDYPNGTYVFDNQVIGGLGFRGAPNPNITWTKVATKNIGLDFEIEDGLLSASFDVFQRDRSGLLATRQLVIPGTIGIELPQENLNADMRRGFDLQVGHSKRIDDFQYNISANVSYSRGQMTHVERAPDGNSYLDWKNNPTDRWDNIVWGYKVAGQFQSYEEILNSPLQGDHSQGNTQFYPGDIKYVDVNNDGVIDELDEVPIGRGTILNSHLGDADAVPEINFGLNGAIRYMNFDINFLLQGATNVNYMTAGTWYAREGIHWLNRNGMMHFTDRWHRKDLFDPDSEWIPGKYPSTYSRAPASPRSASNRADSEFWIRDATYLRLKSLEIGYTVPQSFLIKLGVGVQSARFKIGGFNLITWTGLEEVDPERGRQMIYPITRTFNFGVNIQF